MIRCMNEKGPLRNAAAPETVFMVFPKDDCRDTPGGGSLLPLRQHEARSCRTSYSAFKYSTTCTWVALTAKITLNSSVRARVTVANIKMDVPLM